jgi:HD-GYP domain-containing protein (c-di-GMP phosphodiesterase class II)
MAALERYTLRELEKLIKEGEKYRLFKPFVHNGQMLFNVEKILTEKDIMRLDGKVFGPIEVLPAIEHNADDKVRSAIIENSIKILKTSNLYNTNETHHLDFTKRKECEKLIDAIVNGNPHLAQKMFEIYQHSKKLFIHSVNVGIIATVIDLGLQEKRKIHNALRSEELLTGAFLHDIGLIKLPKTFIEKKRYEYDPKEKEIFKTYPELGKKIVLELGDRIRSKTIDIIYQHQERLHGSGFPQGLKGNDIEEMALIVGIADEFELFVSKEIANHQKQTSEIMSRMARSGNMFGTDVVDSFYTWFRYLK